MGAQDSDKKQLEGRKVIDASVGGNIALLLHQKLLADKPVLTSVINISLYSEFTFFLSAHMYFSLSCCTCKQDVGKKLASVR